MSVILGYWSIRGLAEPIRLLMAECQIAFKEEKFTTQEDLEDFHKNKKPQLSVSSCFPNLPYLLDGDQVICESTAILHHIIYKAKRQDLLGLDDQQKVLVHTILGVAQDLNSTLVSQSYNKDYYNIKDANYQNIVINKLTQLNQHYLKQGTHFITGNNLTLADIKLYENLQHCQHHYNNCLNQFQGLLTFQTKFKQLPNIQAYLNSNQYIPTPFNNPLRATYP